MRARSRDRSVEGGSVSDQKSMQEKYEQIAEQNTKVKVQILNGNQSREDELK
jgi:hypothetical protein